MVSIGSLRYDIVADTTKFTQGVTATRRELSAAKRLFMDTRTPVEKLDIEIQGLSQLLKKGAIDQQTYNRALKSMKSQAEATKGSVQGLVAELKKMPTAAKASIQAFIGFQTVRTLFRTISEDMQRIDDIAKQSRKLGILTTELVGIRFAAAEMSGMMESQVDTAIQKMTRNVSEAAIGIGRARDSIAELGLDARKLNAAGPGQAFLAIADAMKQVTSEQDRLRIATRIFGEDGASLVNTLRDGSEELINMRNRAERLGMTFSDELGNEVEAANDAIYEMKQSWTGLMREFTIGAAGPMKAVADGLREIVRLFRSAQKGGEFLATDFVEWLYGGATPTIGNTPGTMADAQQSGFAAKPEGIIEVNRTNWEDDLKKMQAETLKREKALDQQARSVIDGLRTPVERIADEIGKLQFLRDMGRITAEQFQLAKDTALSQLESKEELQKIEQAQTARRGSREEYQILSQMQNAQNSEKVERAKQAKKAEDQRDLMIRAQDKANELFREFAQKMPEPV